MSDEQRRRRGDNCGAELPSMIRSLVSLWTILPTRTPIDKRMSTS